MTDEVPPWREITTDDYHSRNFAETTIGSAVIVQSAGGRVEPSDQRALLGLERG